jgi:hypothetical protein
MEPAGLLLSAALGKAGLCGIADELNNHGT